MSTAILARPSSQRCSAPGRTRLRLTRRGRLVITLLVSVPIALGIVFAVLNSGAATAGVSSPSHVAFTTVTVQPGETLWQIAEDTAPHSDPRDFVQDVVSLNNLGGASLQAGQQIAIPAKYSHAH